jgi:hypothetical protein
MTVEFGQAVDWSTSPTPADILSNITAYSGGYHIILLTPHTTTAHHR